MKKKKITFIDLFAGIGGFHLAFHREGAECVWVSEWDEPARKTYKENYKNISPGIFKNNDKNFVDDIKKITELSDKEINNIIPDFDILTGGFPCQPFSQAGQKKGFSETRGTLFYDILKILEVKKPKAFFLENVRGLLTHDGGKTISIIEDKLRKLGYSFDKMLVKASDFGLPTLRPRLYMVGFRTTNKDFSFKFPDPHPENTPSLSEFFGNKWERKIAFTLRVGGKGSGMNDRRNWDTYIVDGKVRRITVKEAQKLMGFPDKFVFPVSDSQAMKQLGNSVAVNAIQAVAAEILKTLKIGNI